MTPKHNIEWDDLSTISSFDTGSPPPDKLYETTELFSNHAHSKTITTPISLLIQSLVKQLCVLLEKDHEKAIKLYKTICEKLHQWQLLDETYTKGEFEEMRYQYQMALNQFVKITNDSEIPIRFQPLWSIHSIPEARWSRYYREFEEISFIAGGGFGKVYRAKNRLDGMQYAIKKISIRAKDINSVSKHFNEVQTFASLSHPNIVSYKAAWLEPFVNYESTKSIENVKESTQDNNASSNFSDISDYLSRSESDDFEIRFEDSSTNKQNEKQEAKKNIEVNITSIDECKALCKLMDKTNLECIQSAHIDLQWATLYIQMSLRKMTLKTWLDNRNTLLITSKRPINTYCGQIDASYVKTVMHMFTQLVKGVNYIHDQKIVHHDIKPTNIFVEEDRGTFNVQLADFGLACPLQRTHHKPAPGTTLYAAPEQISGICHVKNDLYSIGLILLELIECFNTNMEKVKTFESLRSGLMPVNVKGNHPKIAQIISKLANNDVESRIDSYELLSILKRMRENRDDTISALQKEIIAREDIIRSKDEEIAKLKELLLMNKLT